MCIRDRDLPTLENPTLDNPTLEKPMLENPTLENPTQLNKDISSKEQSITDLSSTHSCLLYTSGLLFVGKSSRYTFPPAGSFALTVTYPLR